MAKASRSTVKDKKQGLKDRSISDFFSPIPSPASSAHSARVAASSSPAPRAAMALTRGGSDPLLAPLSASGSKLKAVPSRLGVASASTVASGSGSGSGASSAAPASTKAAKAAVAGPEQIFAQPPSSAKDKGKGKGRRVEPEPADEPSSEAETILVRPKSRSPARPPPSALSLALSAADSIPPPAKPAPSPPNAAEDAIQVDDPPSSSLAVSSSLLLLHTSPVKATALASSSSFYSPPPSRVRRPASPVSDASTSPAQAINMAPSSPTAALSDPFALLSTPPRYSGPTYTRSVSGSPLSSIAASPVKPRTKFVGVVIDVAPHKRLPKTLGGSVGTIRRERSVTAAELDSERRNSTSPIKPEPADDSDPYNLLGDLSDDDVVVSDSEASDDDADLLALVAANRAKLVAVKAAGQAIPELQALGNTSPEVRKSGRAVVPPRRSREVQQQPMQQVKAAQSSASKGKLGMLALQKDHEERKRKQAAMEATQRLLDTTDALDGSESDDSDDYMVGTEELTSERINLMVQVATDLAIEQDEYGRSPEKKGAHDKAAMMASVLKSATGTGDGTPAPLEDAKERQAWRNIRILPLVAPTESDGWKGRVAQAIRDGLKQPNTFPLPLQLFSPVAGRGSPEDQTLVSRWLLSLLSHPSTPPLVAERANQFLTRIIAHRALSTTHANSSPLLTAHDIFDELKRLGVRPEVVDAPHPRLAVEMDVDPIPTTPGLLSELVSSDDRRDCLGRMLRVVQTLAGASPRLLCGTDVASLTVCLVRLALDPTAAPLRSALERTLQSLLRTVPVADVRVRCEIVDELLAVFQSAGVRTKLEVVQALPHETKSSKILRKWLAWVLLANPTDAAELTAFARPPPLADVAAFLAQNDPRGPFAISPDMDDVALFQHMMLLTIALSDLNDELFSPDGATARRNALLVQDVAGALHEMDRRIRTDVKNGNPARNKAKNVIMRLEHALTYQAQSVLGVDKMDLGDGGEDVSGRKKQRLDQGQTTLSFARVGAPLTHTNLAQVA